MTNKKVPVHIIFISIYFLLAIVTLIPLGAASKPCYMGYKALCSFSPISTLILLALAGLHIYLQKRAAVKEIAA